MWDVRSGTEIGSPSQLDTKPVESVAFTPNGGYVSASDDGDVRLYPAPAAHDASFAAVRRAVCAFLGSGLRPREWQLDAPHITPQRTC
jgi:hypothetical protein